jgi:hypothetical protein
MTTILEGKSIGSDQKTVLKGELLIWRTNNETRDQGIWSNCNLGFWDWVFREHDDVQKDWS